MVKKGLMLGNFDVVRVSEFLTFVNETPHGAKSLPFQELNSHHARDIE